MSPWKQKSEYIDLTREISEATVVYPGDPPFSREDWSGIIPGGDSTYKLSRLHLGNHTGTHIDYPAHVLSNGKTSSDYSAMDLIGEGYVIEVPEQIQVISADFIAKYSLLSGDFVFFKTKNSTFNEFDKIPETYVHLNTSAAEALIEKGVRVVGIDFLNVDGPETINLPVHHILLSHDVLIVEGLNLTNVQEGRGEIIIAPLKIAQIDGAPARVLFRPW